MNLTPVKFTPGMLRGALAAAALMAGAAGLTGCIVAPADGGPAYIAPAPVYVAPAPIYVGPRYYYGRPNYHYGYRRWR
jgi:hypothetical protein